MTLKVDDALRVLDERIVAASGHEPIDFKELDGIAAGAFDTDQMRLVLVGYDVDADDLMEYAQLHAQVSLATGAAVGSPLVPVLVGVYFQAFMAGLIFRDLQYKAEQE